MTLFHALHSAHFPHAAKKVLARSAERALEGSQHWGRIDVVGAGRSGSCRTRVTVYPPGTTAGERRAMRFYRAWPVAGAVLSMFLLLALNTLPTALAVVAVVGLYAAVFGAASARTRRLRSESRHVEILTVPIGGNVETVGDVRFFNAVTDQLRCIDTLSERGQLTAVGYEVRWAEVYASMPPRA